MSERQHTPGPWAATRSDPAEGVDVWWITTADAGNFEKEIGTVACGAPTSASNARLVAAAPRLLAACRIALVLTVAPSSDTYAADVETIRAAVAEAESQ